MGHWAKSRRNCVGITLHATAEKINGTALDAFERTTYLTTDSAGSSNLLPGSMEVEKSLVLLICVKSSSFRM